MYGYEIQHILDCGVWIKNLNAEVVSKDKLPEQKPYHIKAYIVNTDPSTEEGEHWVAVIFNANNDIFYFDSYGFPPMEKEVLNFIQDHTTRWTFNKQTLQSLLGQTCGAYCIFALTTASQGSNLPKCLQKTFYTINHHRNDQFIKTWLYQNYGTLCTKSLKL